MLPLYLQYLLIDFRQTFVTGASWDTDDLITFLGQKVKVQGHIIAAEAHSTRHYRRVQLFLVTIVIDNFCQSGLSDMGVICECCVVASTTRTHICVRLILVSLRRTLSSTSVDVLNLSMTKTRAQMVGKCYFLVLLLYTRIY